MEVKCQTNRDGCAQRGKKGKMKSYITESKSVFHHVSVACSVNFIQHYTNIMIIVIKIDALCAGSKISKVLKTNHPFLEFQSDSSI